MIIRVAAGPSAPDGRHNSRIAETPLFRKKLVVCDPCIIKALHKATVFRE